MESSPADLSVSERLPAVFDQRKGPHIVVGTDHQPAECVHQREVTVSTIAWAEEVLHQRPQPLVAQPAIEVAQELLFLARSYIMDVLVRVRLLEQRIVLLLIRGCRIVESGEVLSVARADAHPPGRQNSCL